MQFIDLQKQYRLLKSVIDARIQTVLNHGQYILGPEVAQLEERLADYTGAKHCIAVANGTDALMIALMALDIKPQEEVITSPFTFMATAEMISILGAKPVFVDIQAETYNLNPDLIEAAITSKTKCILPVSLYGQCADLTAINAIAKRHNLPVIEDAAQSFGASHHGQKSCNLSTIACTSFFPTKPLGCYGDGGACFTNDEALAIRMRQIRVHGQESRYNHRLLGVNSRLDTIQAAILLSKLDVFDQEIEARKRIGQYYNRLLSSRVKTMQIQPGNTCVYAQYTIEVNDRSSVQRSLGQKNIPTAVHYPLPLHLQPVFSAQYAGSVQLPIAEQVAKRVLSLPMHPYLSEEEQDWIAEALHSALSFAA